MTWQDFYAPGNQGNRFGIKGPFYGPQGHRGQDYHVGAHGVVPAYFTGKCVANGHSEVLGNYSVYKVGSMYLGYAHLLVGTRQDVGHTVKPGDKVGLAAGPGDDHGTAWAGAHCHTTRSDSIGGIVSGNVFDPVPAIKAARAATAKPAPRPATGKKYTTAKSGEGFIKIAKRVGVSVKTLQTLNPHLDGSNLKLNQRVYYA